MIDCFDIKQGMIFFVEDITSETSVVFKGEYTPKKRRPWVIVSNDRCNAFSHTLTGVPIFTRDAATLPTQVFFNNKGRPSVIDCGNVTAIPKEMIDLRGYIGTVSAELFAKIRTALNAQFETSYESDEITKVVNSSINTIVQSLDIKKFVMEQLCARLMGSDNTVNISTPTNNTPTDTALATETGATITETNQPADTSTKVVEKVVKKPNRQRKVTATEDVIIPKKKRNYPKHRKPRGLTMSMEQTLEFYLDFGKYSTAEMYEKWKDYGVTEDKNYQSKKKYIAKKRLEKEGLL